MSSICYKNNELREDRIGQTVCLGLGYAGKVETDVILGEPDDMIQVLCRFNRFPSVMVKYGEEYHPLISENSVIVACGLAESENVTVWDDGRFYFNHGYPKVSFSMFGYDFEFKPFEPMPGTFYCKMKTPAGDEWAATYGN